MNEERKSVNRGDEANLSVLRVAFQQGSSTESSALEQFLDEDERVLMSSMQVTASLICENDTFDDVPALILLTSERLVLWSNNDDNTQADLVADAICIDLHAMSQESSVYIQLTSSDGDTLDLTLTFDSQDKSQALYDALSQLVSLHPIDPNEHEQGQFDDGDDDMFVWAPQEESSSGEASEEERNAMLERLDNLLIVPPELQVQETVDDEQQEGQFDDAEDDNDNEII